MKLEDSAKKNCWDFMGCGRHPGGARVQEMGICPVTTNEDLHGAHDGKNGGRACWVIAGTLCGGKIQGSYAQKLNNCWRCDFFATVKKEEEPSSCGFSATRLGMQKIIERRNK